MRKLHDIHTAYRRFPEAVRLHLEYACWLSAPDVLPVIVMMYMKNAKDHEFWGNMILQDCKGAASAAEIDEIIKSYDAVDFSQYSKLAEELSATQRSANGKIRAIFDEHKKEMAKKSKQVNPALPFALSWRAEVLSIRDRLFCVPATIDLAGAEIELVSMVARENRLRNALADLDALDFDFVFIDCPPSLGLLTLNALVAAPEVLIPIQCEYYALEGVSQLMKNIEMVKAHLNPQLNVSTVLLTMHDGRTKLADQVATEVRRYFGDKVLHTVIPRSVKVSEAPGYSMTIIDYDPGSRGAMSYLDASRELATRQ
jgi:cellulose biosynthesis protein BcsQ